MAATSERIQPLCPIRDDAKCMGAPCAWSVRHVRDDGVWVFTCAVAELASCGRDGKAIVVDERTTERRERT